MSQSLEVNIKTTSDVPAAMNKAKSATVSFSKQVEDIKKKFSTAFKDIFLGFTAPMILLQGAMSAISAAIEKAKQDAKEGLDLIAQGETRFATSEESRAAAFFKRKKELEEEQRLVEAGRTNITKQILDNEGGMFSDFKLPDQFLRQLKEGSATLSSLAQNKEVQRIAMDYFTKTDEGKKISDSLGPSADPTKSTPFKAPEGFGNVIGVGANPVLEAMTRNYEILEQIKDILEDSKPSGGGVPTPFTERLNPVSRTTGP